MPVFLNVGFVKNDQLNSGGTLGFGQNIVQNRTSTKTNQGSFNVGDGLSAAPILFQLNGDTDLIDQTSIEAADIAAPQV
ncbi:hypothetical protein [Desmospora activa]|uniref:Spore germination protein GerPA/GerPF n=1 Tax=Desmospora activa DSM 45169 TaxID=1121389 RepID=A0A2T4Z4W8_9BACL|nr:hypothetical protein [Desmospora activa]PTM56932.1 hypothetical protein C8J48_3261 [Desmospora activa DSM 45169]